MTYRSDTDALEARLDVLQKDLADRERERDEVARMLAEARHTDAARRWLENAPRRRRRRKIIFVAVASMLMMFGGVVTFFRLRHDARRERSEQVLRDFDQFANDACACKDKACMDKVTDRMTKWGQQMATDRDYADQKPDEEMVKRFTPIAERFTKCVTAVMTAESPPSKP